MLLPHPHKVVWMTGPFPLLGDEILDQYRLRAVTRGLGEAEKIFAAGEELGGLAGPKLPWSGQSFCPCPGMIGRDGKRQGG